MPALKYYITNIHFKLKKYQIKPTIFTKTNLLLLPFTAKFVSLKCIFV